MSLRSYLFSYVGQPFKINVSIFVSTASGDRLHDGRCVYLERSILCLNFLYWYYYYDFVHFVTCLIDNNISMWWRFFLSTEPSLHCWRYIMLCNSIWYPIHNPKVDYCHQPTLYLEYQYVDTYQLCKRTHTVHTCNMLLCLL